MELEAQCNAPPRGSHEDKVGKRGGYKAARGVVQGESEGVAQPEGGGAGSREGGGEGEVKRGRGSEEGERFAP